MQNWGVCMKGRIEMWGGQVNSAKVGARTAQERQRRASVLGSLKGSLNFMWEKPQKTCNKTPTANPLSVLGNGERLRNRGRGGEGATVETTKERS